MVVILGQVPLPWAHSHVLLDSDQLREHQNVYHQNGSDGLPICGSWHVHLFCIGCNYGPPGDGWKAAPAPNQLSYVNDQPFTLQTDSDQIALRVSRTVKQVVAFASSAGSSRSAESFHASPFEAPGQLRAQLSLLQLHCALII